MTAEDIIAGVVSDAGRYIAGWADLSGCIPEKFRATPFALAIGRELDENIIDGIVHGPTREYLDHYNAVNLELASVARGAMDIIVSKGADALVIEPTLGEAQIDDEMRQTLRYHFSHKMAATRAGLGWIGKTDLFVSERFGPRLRLATVLTDRALGPVGTPVDRSRCGDCSLCVDACPAAAATGSSWYAGLDRDKFFDARRCRDTCRRLSKSALNEDISLCGVCVAACPAGR